MREALLHACRPAFHPRLGLGSTFVSRHLHIYIGIPTYIYTFVLLLLFAHLSWNESNLSLPPPKIMHLSFVAMYVLATHASIQFICACIYSPFIHATIAYIHGIGTQLFAGPAVLAKQLEARWEASSSSSQCQEVPPAVSAALPSSSESDSASGASEASAGRDHQKSNPTDVNPDANNNNKQPPTATRMSRPYLRRTLLYCQDPLDKNYFPLWKNKERSADVGQELPQLDILAQLFGHDEPEKYNAALLEDKNTWQHHCVGKNGNNKNGGEKETVDRSNSTDGVSSMNSSEENSYRDVSVLKTPPPRKRKRRITPTTTPASKSRPNPPPTSTPSRKNKGGGRAPSTPESNPGDGAVPSPSSSTLSSSSRHHTKLFFDVQMAQSPSKVLSPTTAEMKYGKAFPPYQPKDQATGKWIPPQKPRSAYDLFVDSTRGQARLHLKRRDRNNQVCICVLGVSHAPHEDCVTIGWLNSHH